ncbi:hypothetical protein ABIB14_002918 [Arthrobacter sp. UYEF3]
MQNPEAGDPKSASEPGLKSRQSGSSPDKWKTFNKWDAKLMRCVPLPGSLP